MSTPPNVKTCCAHSGTPVPGHAAGAAAEILGQTQYQPLTGSVEVAGATPGGVAVWKGTEVQGAGVHTGTSWKLGLPCVPALLYFRATTG